MARQCVKPQIRDHSNKALASKDFNTSTGLSMSSKVQELCSRQTSHIRQPVPYSKPLKKNSPTNSSMQSAKRQLYSASPIEAQTSEKLHSTAHEQTYNEVEDDPQFAYHNNKNNTNSQGVSS